jgi:hypothetical protein
MSCIYVDWLLAGSCQQPGEREKGEFCVNMCDYTQHLSHNPALQLFINILFYMWSKNLGANISTVLFFSKKKKSRPRKGFNSKTSSFCALSRVEERQSSPVTGPECPRVFQEVKVPTFHDNGTGWW